MSLHLFAILGFNVQVSLNDVKARYRELAKRYHPDICKENGAEEKFKLISNAYQQLLKLDWQPPIPTPPPRPKEPKKYAEQIIWRWLDPSQKSTTYRITYPNDTILRHTRFHFMLGSEFSIFYEEEKPLPTTISLRHSNRDVTIRIEEGYD